MDVYTTPEVRYLIGSAGKVSLGHANLSGQESALILKMLILGTRTCYELKCIVYSPTHMLKAEHLLPQMGSFF